MPIASRGSSTTFTAGATGILLVGVWGRQNNGTGIDTDVTINATGATGRQGGSTHLYGSNINAFMLGASFVVEKGVEVKLSLGNTAGVTAISGWRWVIIPVA